MTGMTLIGRTISAAEIRTQAAKITASEGFVRSGRMQRFLTFVVEEALAGRAETVNEYAVGIAVFDRGADFDPAIEPIVRNDARRLRAKLQEYYLATTPAEAPIRIQVSKGGYVPSFSHCIEDNNSASPNEAPEPARESSRHQAAWQRNVGVPCVAVLPFVSHASGNSRPLNGEALATLITSKLTHVSEIQTLAMGAATASSSEWSLAQTALQPSHVVNGILLRVEDHVSVVVNLIDVSSGLQVWSGDYAFPTSETFAAHAAISKAATKEIRASLGMHSQKPARVSLAA